MKSELGQMVHCLVNARVYSRSSDVCFDYDGPASLGRLDSFVRLNGGCFFLHVMLKNVKKRRKKKIIKGNDVYITGIQLERN